MITIRPAKLSDIDQLVDLLSELFAIESDFVIDADKQACGLMRLLDIDTACIWVAEAVQVQKVVGMCSIQTLISTAEGSSVGLLEDLIVAAEFRRQGIAAQLLVQAEAWAKKHGLKRLQLLADKNNQTALDFYAHQRWQSTQLMGLRKYP
jgi:ribosomal protein S18 acetylase RimI-like enzyme